MSLPIRKKTVTIDGAEYLISPLTHAAAAQYAEKEKEQKDVRFEVIAFSLNRAAGTQEFTEENLRTESDPLLTKKLFAEILELSGMKTVEKKPGETQAPA